MKKLLDDVHDFHLACGVPSVRIRITIPPTGVVKLRKELIEEEAVEVTIALDKLLGRSSEGVFVEPRAEELVELADGLADLIYVVVGTALAFGIPLDLVWDEVQRSNMAKRNPKTGMVHKRGDGKVLKPQDWSPPDLLSILKDAV